MSPSLQDELIAGKHIRLIKFWAVSKPRWSLPLDVLNELSVENTIIASDFQM